MAAQPNVRTPDRLRVLIVDDDELMVEYISLQIEPLNCEVTGLVSAEAALAALEGADYDLLVTDWQMPGLDGMQLIRRVRERHSPETYLHVAMLTGRDEAAAIRQALAAGADDFLYKPLNPLQLELAVASARRNKALHRRLHRRNVLLAEAQRRTREALDRVKADLRAAAALHRRLLPPSGALGPIELAHVYSPALELGGDTIGAVQVGDGALLFFLIDVRGHGVPASLESFQLHHRLKQLRPGTPERLSEAVAILNREVSAQGEDSYATMICGIVSPQREQGWFIRAGHPPLVIAGPSSAMGAVEEGGGFPLGWFADAVYTPVAFAFPRGGRIVCYSDGLVDCAAEGEFGSELDVIASLFDAADTQPLDRLASRLEQTLIERMPPQGFADDVSLLALENRQPLGEGHA